MSDQPETSPSGSPIYRETQREGWEPGDPTPYGEAISAHVEKFVGPVGTVFHEVFSNRVHVDVLVVGPNDQRPLWTFVTSGMSARPMPLPAAAEGHVPSLAEVMIVLPSDWEFSSAKGQILGDNIGDYPISLLRSVAHFPHDFGTWLGPGHTVPNGDPPKPLSNDTHMCACLLAPVLTLPQEFNRLRVDEGREIGFYGVIPLYEDELRLKLEKGVGELYDLFDRNQVCELFDPTRHSVVPPPKKPGVLRRFFTS